jgi:hypothetical protein
MWSRLIEARARSVRLRRGFGPITARTMRRTAGRMLMSLSLLCHGVLLFEECSLRNLGCSCMHLVLVMTPNVDASTRVPLWADGHRGIYRKLELLLRMVYA